MENPKLKKNYLSVVEIVALSVAIMAPTASMSLNVSLVAGIASYSVAFVFFLAMIVVGFVSLAIIKFNQYFSTAGSVYTFTEMALGKKMGFISGWALLLTYFMFTAGCSAVFGSFMQSFFKVLGINIGWLPLAVICSIGVWFIAYNDVKISTRIMLAFEGLSILLILVLCFVILYRVGSTTGLNFVPIRPNSNSVSDIGKASVFAFLAFAGFEGTSSLGEEAKNPKKLIPIAIASAVFLTGIFYVFSSYVQVLGFGTDAAGLKAMAGATVSVGDLAKKYMSSSYDLALTLGASLSFFSCSLGSASAGSRILFSMSRDEIIPKGLSKVNAKYHTPHIAIGVIMIASLIFQTALFKMEGIDVFGIVAGPIASIGLLIAYLLTTIGAVVYFSKNKIWSAKNLLIPSVSIIALIFVLYASIYPVPEFPANLAPYLTIAWIVLGLIISNKSKNNSNEVKAAIEEVG